METLKFTEQKNASKWKCKIEEVLVAVFFASGLFCCITDIFEVHITNRETELGKFRKWSDCHLESDSTYNWGKKLYFATTV